MKIINSQSKESYRRIVSFVALKGIRIVEKNNHISEWVRNKSSDAIESLLYEGEWRDEDDFDVEMTVLSSLRSAALSALNTIAPKDKSALNGLISFLRI